MRKFIIIILFSVCLITGCGKKDISEIIKDNNIDSIAWEEVEESWKNKLVTSVAVYLGVNEAIYSMNTTFSVVDIDNSGIPEIIINGDLMQAVVTFNKGIPDVKELYFPFLMYDQEHGVLVQKGTDDWGNENCIIYKVENDVFKIEKSLTCYYEEVQNANTGFFEREAVEWKIDNENVSKEEYDNCLNAYYDWAKSIEVTEFALPTYIMLERAIVNFEDYTLSYGEINYEVEDWKNVYKQKIDKYRNQYLWEDGGIVSSNYFLTDFDKSGIPEIFMFNSKYDEYMIFTYNQDCSLDEVVVGNKIYYDYDMNILIVEDNMMKCSYYKIENDELVLVSGKNEASNALYANLKRQNAFINVRAYVTKYSLADAINRY